MLLVDASEMNKNVGFIFISAYERLGWRICVFNIRVWCNLFHRLLGKNLDRWILSILNICSILNYENSRYYMLKLMQLLYRFEFWDKLAEFYFFAGLRMFVVFLSTSVVFLSRSVRLLDSIVFSKPLAWLLSSARDVVKLSCQEAVFICLSVTDERLLSCSRTNPWHIPDA